MARRPYFPMWLIDQTVDEVIEAGIPSPSHAAINDMMNAAPTAYAKGGVQLHKIWYKLSDSTREELWKQHKRLDNDFKELSKKEG